MDKFIAYYRVSTQAQGQSGLGLEAQRNAVTSWLSGRPLDESKMTEIKKGHYFIVHGQLAYVAEVGEDFRTQYDRRDSRLRVIL